MMQEYIDLNEVAGIDFDDVKMETRNLFWLGVCSGVIIGWEFNIPNLPKENSLVAIEYAKSESELSNTNLDVSFITDMDCKFLRNKVNKYLSDELGAYYGGQIEE